MALAADASLPPNGGGNMSSVDIVFGGAVR